MAAKKSTSSPGVVSPYHHRAVKLRSMARPQPRSLYNKPSEVSVAAQSLEPGAGKRFPNALCGKGRSELTRFATCLQEVRSTNPKFFKVSVC